MKRAPAAVFAVLMAACSLTAPPPLFPSRLALAPLMKSLAAAGGDPARVLTVRSEEELSGLRPGRRYKYVVLGDGTIRVAPRPAAERGNEYTHPVLAAGQPVRTAGYLRFERRGATTTDDFVVIDQDSQAYCPTFASLGEARSAFARIGVGIQRVRVEDHPPRCTPTAVAPEHH
jgi:hypothetical protein